VTQAQLDELRGGVTVDGVHYGPIDATLDREQTSNVWITFAIREGKNREVRNVLRHLGLHVARLIRVSFGPFQLGEIADGAIEEVPTRVLREQLGEKLAKAAGANFSAPVVEREKKPAPALSAPLPTRSEAKRRGGVGGGGPASTKPEKKRVTRSAEQKKFHRPKRGEGARPSSDDRGRAATRRAAPATLPRKRRRDKPRDR
jgi:hypothetical protein